MPDLRLSGNHVRCDACIRNRQFLEVCRILITYGQRADEVADVLTEGQEVDAKITAIDEEKQKISLSIRALLAPAAEEVEEDAE